MGWPVRTAGVRRCEDAKTLLCGASFQAALSTREGKRRITKRRDGYIHKQKRSVFTMRKQNESKNRVEFR